MFKRPLVYVGLFLAVCLASLHATQTFPDAMRALGPREWNFLVYMSNNNNLHRYGVANFRQMVQVGSNKNVHIALQMDSLGQKEISRFYIEQNNPLLSETQSNTTTSFSGTPANLCDFVRWGTNNYPSTKTCLVLWNHGAGIKDPSIWGRMIMRWRDDLFILNKATGMLELDRSMSKKEELKSLAHERGIAFNDAAEAYLTNDDLKRSLELVSRDCLAGRKIDVLAMDACHMAMVEIASQVKNSVSVMVASEEVEPGTGWNYVPALAGFANAGLTDKGLGQHLVQSYQQEYRSTLGDYTQSAVDLSYCNALESNISRLADAMGDLMDAGSQAGFRMLREIRFSRAQTIEFFDNDYIDLGQLYKALFTRARDLLSGNKLAAFGFNPTQQKAVETSWKAIGNAAIEGLGILQSMVIANAVGRNLKDAAGLSIYFPISSIHSSYRKTVFAMSTTWPRFLEKFIRMRFGKNRNEHGALIQRHDHVAKTPSTKKPCCDDCAKTGKNCQEEKADCSKTRKTTKKPRTWHGVSPHRTGRCACAPAK